MFRQEILGAFRASLEVKKKLLGDEQLIASINILAGCCSESIETGGKVIFCGNGGSFADAQHLSAEFTSRFLFDRPAAPSVALGTNSSSMSAIGNDYGYDQVFARELSALGAKKDVFIPISTSGSSPNIVAACDVALRKKNPYICTGGREGRKAS